MLSLQLVMIIDQNLHWTVLDSGNGDTDLSAISAHIVTITSRFSRNII